MKKRIEKRETKDDLRREYDLSKLKGGVRGKYVSRYRAGANLVLRLRKGAAFRDVRRCESTVELFLYRD